MKPWTREHTQEWIAQLENRIEDFKFYMNETVNWCANNNIYTESQVTSCLVMSLIWTSQMRNESISNREIMELIGVKDGVYIPPDISYTINQNLIKSDLEELLKIVTSKFG